MARETSPGLAAADDYWALLQRGRALAVPPGARRVRMALLADCSTQHLAAILRVVGAESGLDLDIYEAPFDSIMLEVADPAAALYRFAPDFIVVLNQTEQLLPALLARAPNTAAPAELVARMTAIWDGLAAHIAAPVIQTTFVLPAERALGHYERLVPASLGQRVIDINQGLADAARERRHVLILDADHLAAEYGRAAWRDAKLWYMAKAPCALAALPVLARHLAGIVSASLGRVVKCVVLDLDNTVWGGVIGDDGLEGIALGDLADGEAFVAFQRFLLSLKQRGILLAVCSKNEHANAVLPFERHPDMVLQLSDFAAFVANWNDKAQNIADIRGTLNIGFDSMVFLDDNPFERSLVRGLLPEVIVPDLPEDPADYIAALAALNLFETTTFSQTDAERAELYRVEAARQQAKAEFTSVNDYLRSLDMTVLLEGFSPFNLPRVAQLIQRSNQFNLATRRYGEAECARLMQTPDEAGCFTLTLADRFGSHGLICVGILRWAPDVVDIDEFLMSCRVLQRGVENFAMNHIVAQARARGAGRVIGHYRPTAKNDMVREFYARFGFVAVGATPEGGTRWELDVAGYADLPALMRQIAPAAAATMQQSGMAA
jgi:FkbH-like protein